MSSTPAMAPALEESPASATTRSDGRAATRTARLQIIGGVVALLLFPLVDLINLAALGARFSVFSTASEISPLTYDESALYAPGAAKFAAHLTPFWELDVIELRAEKFSYPVTHEVVFGLLGRLVGMEAAWMLGHAILPALCWLGFFRLLASATGHPEASWCASWFIVVIAAAPRNMLGIGVGSWTQPLELTRLPHPALSTLLLLVALGCLLRVLSGRGHAKVWAAGAGVTLGLLFYTYYFHWLALWPALCLMLVAAIRFRWPEGKALLWTGVVAVVTGAPYIGWTAGSMMSKNSDPLLQRLGHFGRQPDVVGLILLVIFSVLMVMVMHRRKSAASGQEGAHSLWLVTCLLVGAAVAANFHLITGYNAQHEHAYNRLIQPFGIVLGAGLALQFVPRLREMLNTVKLRRALIAGGGAIIMLAANRQVCVAGNIRAFHDTEHPFGRMARQLDAIEGEKVIGTLDEGIRTLLPTVTDHWSFVPVGFRTIASDSEVLLRFAIVARIAGYSEEEALAILKTPSPGVHLRSYAYGLLDHASIHPGLEAEFRRLWRDTDVAEALRSRWLDLVVLPAGRAPAALPSVSCTLVMSDPGGEVYQIQITAP